MIIYKQNENGYTISKCSNDATEVIIPSIYEGKPVTEIGDNAFRNCESLKNIMIPDSITKIGSEAFFGCKSIMNITIPDGVTSISDWTFGSCTSLTDVIISNSVTRIGNNAFSLCIKLTSITIPSGVTKIGNGAFFGCKNLTSITISDSVTKIGNCVFFGCKNLMSKSSIYKAFNIKKNNSLMCQNMTYQLDKWNECSGELKLCKNGLHYCTNLFEIFNYYSGNLDKDIAICECEVDNEILTSDTSKCCARRLKPVRKLMREEIIAILNGEELPV